MINYLYDVSGSTPISMLPIIINHNNTTVRDEFDWIFDSSANRLTKSLYAPAGSVKTHFGEFVNLATEYITVKNTRSLQPVVKECLGEVGIDSSNIKYGDTNINTYIDTLVANVSTLLSVSGLSPMDFTQAAQTLYSQSASTELYGANFIAEPLTEPVTAAEPVSYDESLLYATATQLKRKKMPVLHKQDIQNGHLFTYYPSAAGTVSINPGSVAAIDGPATGTVVDITFNQPDETSDNIYKVLLDRNDGKYVSIKYEEPTCLQLKATAYTPKTGTTWKVYNYSVKHPEDITIDKF